MVAIPIDIENHHLQIGMAVLLRCANRGHVVSCVFPIHSLIDVLSGP